MPVRIIIRTGQNPESVTTNGSDVIYNIEIPKQNHEMC